MIRDNKAITKWSTTNRERLISRGYVFTKLYDDIEISVSDLSPTSKVKVKMKCDYCGCDYDTEYWCVLYGRKVIIKDSCYNCRFIKREEVNKIVRSKKVFEQLEEISNENGYRLLTKPDEFTTVKMNIQFECPKHGIQTMMLDSYKRGHKCKDCGYESVSKKLMLDVDKIEQVIESKNNNKWSNKSEYTGCFSHNLRIRCGCGKEFTTTFANYYRHNVDRCPVCTKFESSGEKAVREFLQENKIHFEFQKQFEECRDKKVLPFDFYLPRFNTCIEFDGKQHYENVFGTESFEKTKKHDNIKNEYCEAKNIKLIRIPYWESGRIGSILKEELSI